MKTETDAIIEGCRLGGISLHQRLATIEYSTIPRLQAEARLIKAELDRRTMRRPAEERGYGC